MRTLSRVALLAALTAAGCASGGPAAITAPKYDPPTMAAAALAAADANKDGKLDAAELDAAPGLKAMLAGGADTNKDKGLDADELKARFALYQADGAGAIAVGGTVYEVGVTGLEGAAVTFVPEDCFGGALVGGKGTTDATGQFSIAADNGLPGLPPGAYRVTIRKPAGGKEAVPARFNTATKLGVEVLGGRASPNFTFNVGGK